MQKLFVLTILFFFASFQKTSAQALVSKDTVERPAADTSFFYPGIWYSPTTHQLIPWFALGFKKSYFADLRHNYDYANAFSCYVGKKFTLSKTWSYKLEPGFTVGNKANSIGVVNYFIRDTKKSGILLNFQGNLATDAETSNYAYEWLDVYKKFRLVKFDCAVGPTEQIFWYMKDDGKPKGEAGFSLRFERGRFSSLNILWLGKYDENFTFAPRAVVGFSYKIPYSY